MPATAEQIQEQYRRSIAAADRLDDIPPYGQPARWRNNASGPTRSPYLAEVYLATAEEQEEDEELERIEWLREQFGRKAGHDHWELSEDGKTLTRHHVQKRKGMFNPANARDLPIPVHWLKTSRKTLKKNGSIGMCDEMDDDWTMKIVERPTCSRKEKNWWRGTTTFLVHPQGEDHVDELAKSLECWLALKKRTEEIDIHLESSKDREGWQEADLAEWSKIADSGAIQVLSIEESMLVRRELQMEEKLDRILPSRFMRKYKHSEQPGEAPVKKSRMCIRGDKDPDMLSLDRFSPTVCTMNINAMMQIAANEGMPMALGDLRNAFCQSAPLQRTNGPLYFSLPKEGIKGLNSRQLVKIVHGVYGLVDAPRHWRRTLTESLQRLGYRQSRMDPCIYVLHHEKKLEGMIAIEVDDLMTAGHQIHRDKMAQLQKLFSFGKWVNLQECEDGASFNGRRIKQNPDCGFEVDMEKFVKARLPYVVVPPDRKKQKQAEVTEEERKQARMICGALNWIAKEGRPDAAGVASLMSSRLNKMVVEDLLQLNDAIKEIKGNAALAISIQPLKKMRLAVVTDASFANHGFHSQGGQMILSHEEGLKEGLEVKTNLLWWRSGKLQRVVNSTLAAETQSLSRGIGDLMWLMLLFKEIQEPDLHLRDWAHGLKNQEIVAMASSESDGRLKESLAIVDAKSLYDYLSKETLGGQDRRTAIEVQIVRDDLSALGGQIRWVDHVSMVADALTKVKGAMTALKRLLTTGRFSIRAEKDLMATREEARNQGRTTSDLRKKGTQVNKSLGSCETSMEVQP